MKKLKSIFKCLRSRRRATFVRGLFDALLNSQRTINQVNNGIDNTDGAQSYTRVVAL